MSYYNTVAETGEVLQKAHAVVNAQERYIIDLLLDDDPDNNGATTDEVTQIIRERKSREFKNKLESLYLQGSPFHHVYSVIESHYSSMQFIIISVRRSMTDLCEAGILERTDKKRKGTSGRNNYIYKRK